MDRRDLKDMRTNKQAGNEEIKKAMNFIKSKIKEHKDVFIRLRDK